MVKLKHDLVANENIDIKTAFNNNHKRGRYICRWNWLAMHNDGNNRIIKLKQQKRSYSTRLL